MTKIIEPENSKQPRKSAPQNELKKTTAAQGEGKRALVGFLFSYSNTATGEFWPLFEGKNTIGSSANNDIILLEAGVSEMHASVFVIKKRDETSLDFRIQDAGSSNSTIVDKQQLFAGDVTPLKERSVVSIGGYTLIATLVDYAAEQLVPNPGFESREPEEEDLSAIKGELMKSQAKPDRGRTRT